LIPLEKYEVLRLSKYAAIAAFIAAITSSLDENFFPPNYILRFGNRKKSQGAKSGE